MNNGNYAEIKVLPQSVWPHSQAEKIYGISVNLTKKIAQWKIGFIILWKSVIWIKPEFHNQDSETKAYSNHKVLLGY